LKSFLYLAVTACAKATMSALLGGKKLYCL